MLDRQRLQPRQPFCARLAPRRPERQEERLKERNAAQAVQRQHFALREVPSAERRRCAAHLRAPGLVEANGADGCGGKQQESEQHLHSSIRIVPFSASRTAASTACAVTLSQASRRAFSRSLGWAPRTTVTVPAPEAPPEQAWATRRTTTSHRSPRLPSVHFSSGVTSSSVESLRSLRSRVAQAAMSGRKPSRLTALRARSDSGPAPPLFSTTPTTRRARASSTRASSWFRSPTYSFSSAAGCPAMARRTTNTESIRWRIFVASVAAIANAPASWPARAFRAVSAAAWKVVRSAPIADASSRSAAARSSTAYA